MADGMRILITGGSGFIGTNMMAHYLRSGLPVLNLDWNPPLDMRQAPHWVEADIMDQERVRKILLEFGPTHIIHLAARADTDEPDDIQAYIQNHEGTRRLLEVVKELPTLRHIVVTSTQFVCEAGYQPAHDLDFKPFTLYGETKRLTEMAVREAGLGCTWTIIRPTTIWGPWSLRYRDVMFKVMSRGLYFHPSSQRVIRSYGYVGNVVWQVDRMLHMPHDAVHGRVFYVGDEPFDLKDWVNAISLELTGHPVRYLPTWMVRGLARVGDVLKSIRLPFPITSGRYRSMTSDYITPMDATMKALGRAPHGLEDGVREFIRWYREESAGAKAHVVKDVRQYRPTST